MIVSDKYQDELDEIINSSCDNIMEYIMYTQADDLKEVKSIVDSRNGIMYSETNITYQNASKAKEISYLKDDTQYMIMFLGYLTLNEKDLYYDIIDSITFDE